MKAWFDRNVWATMFLSVWVCTPLSVYLIRHITITPMPWHEIGRFILIINCTASPIFAMLGFMTDSLNRDHLKKEFLRKLES